VKFFPTVPQYEICDMNGADVVGQTYTVKYGLKANDKTAIFAINVTFIEKPVVDLTFDDLNKVGVQDVNIDLDCGGGYEGKTASVDVEGILSKLGVGSLDDVTIYAVLPDGSLDDMYKVGTTDGWRDADGTWKSWSGDISTAPSFYVKADFGRTENQIYEAGGYPGKTDEEVTFTATYVFVKTGTTDAVVLNVNLLYRIADAINGFAIDGQNARIYDLQGRKVEQTVKGNLYIINGKKVLVK
jgi:hypothetical protein